MHYNGIWGVKMSKSISRVALAIISGQLLFAMGDLTYVTQTDITEPFLGPVAYVVLDSARYEPSIIGVSKAYREGISPREFIEMNENAVALGSGFLESFYPLTPLGLLVINNKTVNQLLTVGPRFVLYVNQSTIEVVHRDSVIYFTPEMNYAVQVGPMLVQDGANVIFESEIKKKRHETRAFFGIDGDGNYVVGITETRVPLYFLAEWLSNSTEDGGLNCKVALNFSGGSSESLVVSNYGEIEMHGNYISKQASLLVFQKKLEE